MKLAGSLEAMPESVQEVVRIADHLLASIPGVPLLPATLGPGVPAPVTRAATAVLSAPVLERLRDAQPPKSAGGEVVGHICMWLELAQYALYLFDLQVRTHGLTPTMGDNTALAGVTFKVEALKKAYCRGPGADAAAQESKSLGRNFAVMLGRRFV